MSFAPQHVRAIDVRTETVLQREELYRNIITMLLEAVELRNDPLHSKDEIEASFEYVVQRARAVMR